MKLKKFEGNPILAPFPGNEWESLVTCNPGVYYDNGTFYTVRQGMILNMLFV